MSESGTERIYKCHECYVGLTSNKDRRCEECGCRDWMEESA